MLECLLMRSKYPDAEIAMAFPNMDTYLRLIQRVRPSLARLGFRRLRGRGRRERATSAPAGSPVICWSVNGWVEDWTRGNSVTTMLSRCRGVDACPYGADNEGESERSVGVRPKMHVQRHRASLLLALVVAGCGSAGGPGEDRAPDTPVVLATHAVTEQPTSRPTAPGSTAVPVLGTVPIGATERATVVRIVDGDTILVDRCQGAEKLRYIGVDTPETAQPNTPIQFLGEEAAAANRALVDGRDVLLERDLTEYDKYDRLLRYVWVEDPAQPSGWLLVNLALVAQGYAQVVTYPPDVRYVDLYLAAQRAAREHGLGLWSEPTSAPATQRPLVGDPRAGCDAAYPGVCIPPAPPDLDCGDVSFRRFEVLPPDPHRFDLDFDGIGCEGA